MRRGADAMRANGLRKWLASGLSMALLLVTLGVGACASPLSGANTNITAQPPERLVTSDGASPTATGSTLAPTTIYAIGGAGNLEALTTTTGATQWSVHVGGQSFSGQPSACLDSVMQGILFVTAVSSAGGQCQGHVTAIDLQTHKVLWTTHLTVSYLAAQAGVVYVSDSTGVAALDARTDKRLWHYDEPEAYPAGFDLSADVGYLSYAQTAQNPAVDAIQLSDGSRLWHSVLAGAAYAGPIYSSDAQSVYVTTATLDPQNATGENYQITALNAATGQRVWGAQLFGGNYDMHVADGQVFVHTTGSDVSGNLRVFNAQTGQETANFGGSALRGCVAFAPLITAIAVYAPCSVPGRFIAALDPHTGAQLWRHPILSDFLAIGGADGKVVYAEAQGDSPITYALRSSNGITIWRHPGSLATATAGVALFVTGLTLYAYDGATGRPLWKNTTLGSKAQTLAA